MTAKGDMKTAKSRCRFAGWLVAAVAAVALGREGVGDPERAFRDPPVLSRPGVWWHWMGCNVTREGITRDLEALKEAGFGSATIFAIADTCTPWACPIANSPTAGSRSRKRATSRFSLRFITPW